MIFPVARGNAAAQKAQEQRRIEDPVGIEPGLEANKSLSVC